MLAVGAAPSTVAEVAGVGGGGNSDKESTTDTERKQRKWRIKKSKRKEQVEFIVLSSSSVSDWKSANGKVSLVGWSVAVENDEIKKITRKRYRFYDRKAFFALISHRG